MDIETLVKIAVFAPLLGATIAGLFGRRIGDVASQAITTSLLFVSCAISWMVFTRWLSHDLDPFTITLAPFIHVGDFISIGRSASMPCRRPCLWW